MSKETNSNLPLNLQFEIAKANQEIDAATDIEQLKKLLKEANELLINQRYLWSQMLKEKM